MLGISHSPSTLAWETSGTWTEQVIDWADSRGCPARTTLRTSRPISVAVRVVLEVQGRSGLRLGDRVHRLYMRLFEHDLGQDALVELPTREPDREPFVEPFGLRQEGDRGGLVDRPVRVAIEARDVIHGLALGQGRVIGRDDLAEVRGRAGSVREQADEGSVGGPDGRGALPGDRLEPGIRIRPPIQAIQGQDADLESGRAFRRTGRPLGRQNRQGE